MMEPSGGLHKRNVQLVDGRGPDQDVKLHVDNQNKAAVRSGHGADSNDD